MKCGVYNNAGELKCTGCGKFYPEEKSYFPRGSSRCHACINEYHRLYYRRTKGKGKRARKEYLQEAIDSGYLPDTYQRSERSLWADRKKEKEEALKNE